MIMTGDSGLLDVPVAGGERPLLRFGCNGVVSPSGLSTSRVPMTLISGAFDVVIRSVPSGRLRRGLLWSPGVSFLRVITRGQISGLCLNKVFGGIGARCVSKVAPRQRVSFRERARDGAGIPAVR